MKLAFASNEGSTLDCHFGQCSSFTICELDEAGYRLTELRQVPELEGEDCDRFRRRVELIRDCSVLYVTKIGGEATEHLLQEGIILLQSERGSEIAPQLDQLHEMLITSRPRWLMNALSRAQARASGE